VAVAVVLAQRGASAPGTAATPTPATSSSPVARLDPATGQTVDGIACERQEQALYHIHAHLAIFVRGQPRQVPEGIGIPNPQTQPSTEGPFVVSGSCFYWLHSHAADGVIHVEAPVQRTFTLGDWFDLWGQPLTSAQVAADSGTVIAYVNGRRHDGDPRSIPLESHAVIQLDVGTDVAPQPYAFPAGL